MGELRLYAIGIEEVRSMFGAPPQWAERLRQQAVVALAPPHTADHGGLLSKLGPIFRRPPGTPVLDPDDPVPADLERILAGAFVPAERRAASWRLLELLIKENAWGFTSLSLHGEKLDSLDFALARGGVHAAAGLRHLLSSHTELPLIAPRGLLVGFQSGEEATWMADSYRQAIDEIEDGDDRERVYALANWLDGFSHWADVAPTLQRPAPDLIGFWGVT
ncbi:hypothetical protein FOE78_21075 [Microlunatus elymi]|uniref:DUF7691 domain-containing protein n=1 Tax=Microlunatus elymi TaxID=2596828 RepID=A0A516Q3R8_9ACTN|nr:hypothetical protein [Microlunatus elymi]QDP98060.1 hypothetical protein FOE78_21075 [Microlunatus elymi]